MGMTENDPRAVKQLPAMGEAPELVSAHQEASARRAKSLAGARWIRYTQPADTTGREQIAAAFHCAAMLVLRHLGYGARQSSTSLSVLALLEHEGPTRISALVAAAGLRQPAMTGLVGRLHEGGLVKRFSDHSMAAQSWSITSTGS
jgi:MarR family